MKQKMNQFVIAALGLAMVVTMAGLSLTGCDDGSTAAAKRNPVAADYEISSNLTQTAGSVSPVTVTPKKGKSKGLVSVFYDKSPAVPQTAGIYAVTFNVAAAKGWNAAAGLKAGMLLVNSAAPITDELPPLPPPNGISLSVPSLHAFASANSADYTPTPLSITITNTNEEATGDLTISLSGPGAGSFTLSGSAIESIDVGGTGSFTVSPKPGLAIGTYTATVTVSGDNGIFAAFNVSFTVNDPSGPGPGPGPDPVYSISLSKTGNYEFAEATAGYDAQTPLTVTVTNNGNQETGALTAALSGTGANSFTLSTTSINSIAVGGSGSFTVVPKTGLAAGIYDAAVTVSGGNGITAAFNVKFTVNAASHGISLSATGTHTFTEANIGYGAQTPLSVTVTNTNAQEETGALTVALSGTNAGSFTLSTSSIASIAVGGSSADAFTVVPKTGLAEGSYTATVTVSGGDDITAGFNVSFEVYDPAGIYIITGNGTEFTATRGGAAIGTANQPIQTVINAVRTHAAGRNSAIQFGDGTSVLDIGSTSASFNNSGGTWGAITLTGKITGNATFGETIKTADAVSVTSTADITNTYTFGYAVNHGSTGTFTISGGTVSAEDGAAVYNYSTGTVTISGGTVSATGSSGYTVQNYSTGTVTISGGTVSATRGYAVYNNSTGKITVTGTANVTSANTRSSEGTIYLSNSGSATDARLEITGGTVENTSSGSGSSEGGNAIYNRSTGAVIISGGTVSATGVGGKAIYIDSAGKVTVSGTARVTSANTNSYGINYTPSTIYLSTSATAATLLDIQGGTVENTATSNLAIAVLNESAGTVSISGGTVSTAQTNGYAVYNNHANAKLTLGGNPGPTITGIIRLRASGQLSAAGGFNPGSKNYTLEFPAYNAGDIAVEGGASCLSNFTLNNPSWGPAVGGSDLIIVSFYSISLSETGTYIFEPAIYGYATAPVLTVTVTNTGTKATGDLTVTLGGTGASDYFTLSATSISSIAVGGSSSFTVVPKTGLVVSSYAYGESVNVSGTNMTTKSFYVNFTVNQDPGSPYIITRSGETLIATKGGASITSSSGSLSVANVSAFINRIRSNAAGNAAAIQFGDGTTALDIGTIPLSFNNTDGTWGAITLSGKITGSVVSSSLLGISTSSNIVIADNISVTSTADITHTSGYNALYHNSTGTLTISGGTIQGRVYNNSTGTVTVFGGTVTGVTNYGNGTVNITGGTVSSVGNSGNGTVNITGGTLSSVSNTSNGAINISGGTISTTGTAVTIGQNSTTGKVTISGTARVTSSAGSAYSNEATIFLQEDWFGSPTNNGVRLEISGGTVENTATYSDGKTILNNSYGSILISGGTVSAVGGTAINVYSPTRDTAAKITVSGTATKITSKNSVSDLNGPRPGGHGTIFLGETSATSTLLEIQGGTVENTAGGDYDYAIYNLNGAGRVTISTSATIIGKKVRTP